MFEVHRVLVVKAPKNAAEALEFGIGQWLRFHGKPLISDNLTIADEGSHCFFFVAQRAVSTVAWFNCCRSTLALTHRQSSAS
jgi:hypothetical protein